MHLHTDSTWHYSNREGEVKPWIWILLRLNFLQAIVTWNGIKTTLNLSSFLSHVFVFFYNSSHHPVKYEACLFCVSFHRRVLLSRASPRPSLKSGLRSDETLWPRCMWFPWKSQHSKVAEKPFVLLNGCKEWQSARGRLAWRMFDRGLIYSPSVPLKGDFFLFFFFLNGDKLLGTRLLCIPSQESVWLSLPPNAAILDKFMKKQMAATGALPAVLGLCAVFGWKKTRRSVWNPARSSVPVNNSFVFLVEWKESNCFCSAALHLFSCYLYCGRERRSEDGSEEKRKQPVTKSLLIVNWC